MPRYVYAFEDEPPEPAAGLLGNKGLSLVAMTKIGVPVPPGFTVTTNAGDAYRVSGHWPAGLQPEVDDALAALEAKSGRRFGDTTDVPLLVAVRSGAQISMPGMMDTVLDVGLTSASVDALAKLGDRRFALDAYRRLLRLYGDVVMGVPGARFDDALARAKAKLGVPARADAEPDGAALEVIVEAYLALIADVAGRPFPQDPRAQLWEAMGAVVHSWETARAVRFRSMQGIETSSGSACTVQAMVFGNLGPTSGSIVAFTRNPSTGEKMLYGEYLPNVQGEDIVSGTKTPEALGVATSRPGREDKTLERAYPETYRAIESLCGRLEHCFGDVQDVEITIEAAAPYLLQTRRAKRTPRAAVRIAVEMVGEGAISRRDAIDRIEPGAVQELLRAQLPPREDLRARGIEPLTRGLPASAGAAVGRVVFDADVAIAMRARGERPILVRRETSPEDVHGMRAAEGVLTAAGGMTSHAAVVARGLGRSCVAGCGDLRVDYAKKTLTFVAGGAAAPATLSEGDWITLDGTTGDVYAGEVELVAAPAIPEVETLLRWADAERALRIYAIAGDETDARLGRAFGADGIVAIGDGASWADQIAESAPEEEIAIVVPTRGGDRARAMRLDATDLPAEALVARGDEVGLLGARGARSTHIARAAEIGLLWVAVPVFQVPMARLSAAQARRDASR